MSPVTGRFGGPSLCKQEGYRPNIVVLMHVKLGLMMMMMIHWTGVAWFVPFSDAQKGSQAPQLEYSSPMAARCEPMRGRRSHDFLL
jgi:hypothetical protein